MFLLTKESQRKSAGNKDGRSEQNRFPAPLKPFQQAWGLSQRLVKLYAQHSKRKIAAGTPFRGERTRTCGVSVPPSTQTHLHPPGQETARTSADTPNGPKVSLPKEKPESNVHFDGSSVWNLLMRGGTER